MGHSQFTRFDLAEDGSSIHVTGVLSKPPDVDAAAQMTIQATLILEEPNRATANPTVTTLTQILPINDVLSPTPPDPEESPNSPESVATFSLDFSLADSPISAADLADAVAEESVVRVSGFGVIAETWGARLPLTRRR